MAGTGAIAVTAGLDDPTATIVVDGFPGNGTLGTTGETAGETRVGDIAGRGGAAGAGGGTEAGRGTMGMKPGTAVI